MHIQKKSHITDIFFTLALLGLFAAASLTIILTGAKVYQNISSSMEDNYTTRTALAYTAEKIRQHDAAGQISLTKIGETPALCLQEQINGTGYSTYLYEDGGTLKEMLIESTAVPSISQGTPVTELSDFSIEPLEDGFFQISAEDLEGKRLSLIIRPKSNS